MKKVKLSLVLLGFFMLATASANAQGLNKKTAGKLRDHILSLETYNYNATANKYLTDMPSRSDVLYVNGKNTIYTSRLIKTGRKDSQGNEIMHIELSLNNAVVGYITPDFDEYSVFARFFEVRNKKSGGETIRTCYSSNYFLLPTNNQSFAIHTGGTSDGEVELSKTDKDGLEDNKLSNRMMGPYWEDFLPLSQTERNEVVEKIKATWKKENKAMVTAAWDWAEKKLKEYEGKNYNELIKEVKLDNAFLKYTSLGSGNYDSCKVVYKYDTKGNVNEIVFQFPFIDNKYYDKEQFYARATKNSSGFFEIKNQNSALNLRNGAIIFPFEGSLFIKTAFNSYSPGQIVSATLFNPLEANLLRKDKFFTQYNESDNETKGEYETVVKFKTFQQQYDYKSDLLLPSIFFEKYVKGLKMK